jgi:hypothetical protein
MPFANSFNINMMKYLLVLFFLIIYLDVNSQTPHRRDTSFVGFEAGRAEAINAPILRGNAQGLTIIPNRQQFCFDLEMDVELYFGGSRSRETTVFVNTTDGYLGYTTPSAGGPISDLIPEAESFRFTIISFKLGNIYTYFNQKGNQGLEHLVSTSNSDTHEYQMNNLLTAAPLYRKSEHRVYCDGKAQALAYKRNDGPTVWYVYGDRYPSALQVQKFLGAFGVGVARTNAGVYMVMELEMGRNHTSIKHIERRRVCFNPAGFKMQEADFYAKRGTDLQQEQTKIDEDERKAQNAPCCTAERMAEINFRRQELRVQQDNLRKSQQGNLMQDRVAQKAMLDTMDPLVMVQGAILSTKTSICITMFYRNNDPTHSQARIDCLNQQLSALTQAESQMRAAETRYSSNLARVLAEKSRIYMTVFRQGGCN